MDSGDIFEVEMVKNEVGVDCIELKYKIFEMKTGEVIDLDILAKEITVEDDGWEN